MQVHLAFGKDGLPITLPSGPQYQILEAKSATAVADPLAAIESALDSPLAGPSLHALAAGKTSAAISVCDITRPAPNRLVLPPLLARLHAAGIPRDAITICIATGLHRLATDAELREILGPDIAAAYPVYNHNARSEDEHRPLGTSSTGTPVAVAKAFVDADLHLTLGFIEPHLMAGFSGGRKLIAPGLAYEDTIKTLHSPRFMRDRRAVEGSLDDNPLHRELLEISRLARHDFMVDVALTRTRAIAQVFAGDPYVAHHAGTSFVREALLERLPRPADAVITTAAGYPLDLTFYQTVKGITAAAHLVREGGPILVCAQCQEGTGAPEFRARLHASRTPAEFLALLDREPVVIDQWQLEKLALVMDRHPVLFYVPGMPASDRAALWGPSFDTIDSALAALLQRLPANALVAVIPEGPYVHAKVEPVPEPALV